MSVWDTALNYIGEAADATQKISNAVNSFNNHSPATSGGQAPIVIQQPAQTTSPTSKYMEYGAIALGVFIVVYFIVHKK